MLAVDSDSRLAITLRMVEGGTNWSGAVIAGAGALATGVGGAAAGAGAETGAGAALAVPPLCAASISARTIRPFGPLPFNPDKSIPAWFAIRRANGDAKTRCPSGACP